MKPQIDHPADQGEVTSVEVQAPQSGLPESAAKVEEILTAKGGEALKAVDAEIDQRLQSLIVDPINALPETRRYICGKVRSGEEIARAIPDVKAFLEAMTHRREGKFFELAELNAEGQLVMADGCPEAYGLGENFPTATMRQTRVYYRGEDGTTQSMEGKDYYIVEEVDDERLGKLKILALSEAAQKIAPESIIMQSGLPTLKWEGDYCDGYHEGECVRINTAADFKGTTAIWVDDDRLDRLRIRRICGLNSHTDVNSLVQDFDYHDTYLGSIGVLRVNLNLED